jgi:putative transposase
MLSYKKKNHVEGKMGMKRKQHSAEFKFKVALEAAKEQKTLSQLGSEYELHPTQISEWKRQLLSAGVRAFGKGESKAGSEPSKVEIELYEQIGRLKMELEWLKKKLPATVEEKRAWIEPAHESISVRQQCEWLGLNRSTYYYESCQESELNLQLMRLIDEQYLKTPFYGWPRMTTFLQGQGYAINQKRVQRLMQKMGIQAIYPKPRTTLSTPGHKIYPYLLRDGEIVRPNQVWSTDITDIPLANGFMYLVAVIDWYSRYILDWRLSNTLDGIFCIEALQQALTLGHPEIFNSDSGSQFTATAFTDILEAAEVRISMDGRGRALDNIFIERFWRSLKYEDVYLKNYVTVSALNLGLEDSFDLYNYRRPHQALGYRTPAQVYGRATQWGG